MSSTFTFGTLLRQLRKRAGMTQGDLAAAIGYSVSFVCDLEQNRRLPTVAVVLQQFVPALGLQEEAGFAAHLVELAALARDELLPETMTVQRTMQMVVTDTFSVRPSHLPAPPTALLGREQAVKILCNRLQGHNGRLLTLVGPPGVGKTRLGLAVAAQLERVYQDGAHFVPLAAISDPALVAAELVTALPISDLSQRAPKIKLIEFLRRKELLLVLDNFEQITPAAGLVVELLAECPGLRLLVTSRERLHLRAEQRYQVPPLALAVAVELFTQRAEAVDFAFEPTAEQQPFIKAICKRLDCLPLAIELIAARIDLFSPQSMLTRLQERRLDLLADGAQDVPERQRTLRTAIQYSYALLDERAQRLFRTLGVFAGGFDLAAVVHFGYDEAELQVLVHKNLVKVEGHAIGTPRFLLLETLRDYALEQLAQANEIETVQRTHALYFFELAKQTTRGFSGNEWNTYPLKQEVDNLRVAHRWIVTHESATLEMQFLIQIYGIGGPGGQICEMDRWFEAALPRIKPERTIEYAYFLFVLASGIAYRQGNLEKALAYAEESLALHRQLEHPFRGVVILDLMAYIHYVLGNYVVTRSLIEECVSIAREASPTGALPNLLGLLWDILIDLNDKTTAQGVLHEMVSLYPSLEGPGWQAQGWRILAEEAFLQGNLNLARARCEEALQLFQSFNDTRSISETLLLLSRITYRQGDKTQAIIVLEELLPLARTLGAQTFLYTVLLIAGLAAQENGELLQAQALLTECLALAQENAFLYDKGRQQAKAAYLLNGLAGLFKSPALAARLLGAASKLLSTPYRFPKLVVEHSHYRRILATVRAQLDEATFAVAYAAGYAMTIDQAVALALAQFAENKQSG